MSPTDQSQVLELEYPADARVVAEIRDRIEQFVRAHGISTHDLEDVKMAISEACGNAICHGSPRGAKDRLRIRCQVEDDCLHLEIIDDGPGFQPKEIKLPNME